MSSNGSLSTQTTGAKERFDNPHPPHPLKTAAIVIDAIVIVEFLQGMQAGPYGL